MARRGISSATDKPKHTKKTLMRLIHYVQQHIWWFVLASFMTLLANVLQLLGPYLMGTVIDLLQTSNISEHMGSIMTTIGYMIGFYLVSSLFSYVLQILMIHISQKIVVRMRQDLFNKFMDVPIKYFDNHQIGDLISRISYDIDTVNTSMSSDIIQLAGSVITVMGSFAMMFSISPVLLLVFVITIPASIATTTYLAKKTRPLFRKRSAALGELNGFVEETISGQKTIKAYSQEETIFSLFREKNEAASTAYYEADYYGGITGPSVSFINNLSQALVSLFGAILFLYQLITLGNISSFILYSRKFSGPINETANIFSELQSSLAAAERVFRVLDEPSETFMNSDSLATSKKQDSQLGEIEFDRVHFRYLPDKPVIQNLNLHVQPGNLVAIVGPTGAGKTTIINLLMRFYDIDEGAIRIDQKSIQEMSRQEVRSMFAMVLQDSWLFYGTIHENIAYGNPLATRQDVIDIAKELNIHSFISRLPNGYDSLITDDGVNISKGQKQLLTIARAMLQNRSMVILDEATSNVDTRTEIHIQKAMRKLMSNKTCFVIAHRLSTIRNADVILVVQDGSIVEQGKHEDLMKQQGYYHQLFMAQFQ